MHTHTKTYIHTYIRTCMHAYMHTCIHAYMHTCIHTYIHRYTHTYIHTYIDRYIHTYIHTLHTLHTYITCITYITDITCSTYITYIPHIHCTTLHYVTFRYVTLHTYLHTLPTYYLRADGLLRSKHRRTSFRRVGWWRLGMLAQACGARKISRTLQDQSPTDCRAANISLHRFVALGGCAFRWCR